MGSRINTILIIGGTSGIGEAFARRFHNDGKEVIITGRRNKRLSALQSELSGIATRQVRMRLNREKESRYKC
jgi:short-subunit dehydrogenase involved in D-alanine esterification of teichoic acids